MGENVDKTLKYAQILAALIQKRELLEEAIQTIERLAREESDTESGRPPAWIKPANPPQSARTSPAKKRRAMSEAGKQNIREASKKYWATKRAAQKTAAKTAKPRKRVQKATAKQA